MQQTQRQARCCASAADAAQAQLLELRQPQWPDANPLQLGVAPSVAGDSASAQTDAAPWQPRGSEADSSVKRPSQQYSLRVDGTTDYRISLFTTRRLGASTTAKVFCSRSRAFFTYLCKGLLFETRILCHSPQACTSTVPWLLHALLWPPCVRIRIKCSTIAVTSNLTPFLLRRCSWS